METYVQDQTQLISKMSEKFKDFLDDLRKKVQSDDDNRLTWKMKLITAANQRLGIKRITNKPYPGAPCIPLPETDKLIRKQKPNYVMSHYNQKDLMDISMDVSYNQRQITPETLKSVERAKIAMNYVMHKKMNWLKKLAIAADNFLEKGHCIFKVIEKYDSIVLNKVIDLTTYPKNIVVELKAATDDELLTFLEQRFGFDLDDEDDEETLKDVIKQFRSGEEIIQFSYEDVRSFPEVIIPPAEKIIVPSFTMDIDTAERITHEYFLTKREVIQNAEAGIFDKSIIDKVDKLEFNPTTRDDYDILDTQLSRNEGINDNPASETAELYRFRETVTWYKPEKSKSYERWVFTYLPDVASVEDSLVQHMPFPYEIPTWNYIKHDHESKSWRYHDSRGLPEMIRAIQEFMERALNNMLIRDDINNAPIYTVLSTSKIQSNNLRFIPGSKVRVSNHGEIQRLDDGQNKVDLSSERINQTLKAYAEEYLGSVDQLFRNQTNKGGGKTLGEITEGIQQSQNLMSLDLMLWNETLKRVYTTVFYILKDRLDEPLVVEGVTITKEDFNFVPDITPTGSIESLDKRNIVAKLFQHYQVLAQEIQRGIIVTPEDLYNSLHDYLEADGARDADRYISTPEEVQQLKQQQAQAEQAVIEQQDAQLAAEQKQVQARARGTDVTGAGTQQPTQV
jgi:hypothetical protein